MPSFFLAKIQSVFFPHLPSDPDILSRAWLMFWTCVISGGILLLIIFVSSTFGFTGLPFTMTVVGHTCVILCVFSLRFTSDMRVPSLLIGVVSTFQLMQASYWTGGLESSVVFAYPILPVFLVYISGISVAILSGVLLICTLVSFTFIEIRVLEISPFVDLMVLIWVLCTGVFIAGFAHYRETNSRKRITTQVEKQQEMQKKIEVLVEEHTVFWSNISHELRNNITILFSFSELLKLENPTGKQHKYTENMLQTCTHIQALLDRTMILTHLNSDAMRLERKDFSLNALLLSLQQKFSIQANEKNISLIMEIETQTDSIYSDEHRLEQVLSNLLSNAIKFTHQGSIFLRVEEQQGMLKFSVQDTGIGIPIDEQEAIFEPYHRLHKRKTQGMGLGLSIVKITLERLGSELVVESRPKEGAKFSFILKI